MTNAFSNVLLFILIAGIAGGTYRASSEYEPEKGKDRTWFEWISILLFHLLCSIVAAALAPAFLLLTRQSNLMSGLSNDFERCGFFGICLAFALVGRPLIDWAEMEAAYWIEKRRKAINKGREEGALKQGEFAETRTHTSKPPAEANPLVLWINEARLPNLPSKQSLFAPNPEIRLLHDVLGDPIADHNAFFEGFVSGYLNARIEIVYDFSNGAFAFVEFKCKGKVLKSPTSEQPRSEIEFKGTLTATVKDGRITAIWSNSHYKDTVEGF